MWFLRRLTHHGGKGGKWWAHHRSQECLHWVPVVRVAGLLGYGCSKQSQGQLANLFHRSSRRWWGIMIIVVSGKLYKGDLGVLWRQVQSPCIFFKKMFLVTYFLQGGPTAPKVPTTPNSITTWWQRLVQLMSLWKTFQIQSIIPIIARVWESRGGAREEMARASV